ncbi:hypothetical protein I79_021558 [Cricetulus griseus]|uniref:Uncharacterized protein n=1 Tax=Cricetulus griseus TaxID=10029 RepID=G3ICZ7_CRIGR|nr:hypothetical protein I79_021558 [Cricetulus griseus]
MPVFGLYRHWVAGSFQVHNPTQTEPHGLWVRHSGSQQCLLLNVTYTMSTTLLCTNAMLGISASLGNYVNSGCLICIK